MGHHTVIHIINVCYLHKDTFQVLYNMLSKLNLFKLCPFHLLLLYNSFPILFLVLVLALLQQSLQMTLLFML